MKPSHIYQPVLIRALVEAGGKATLRQLAQVFVSQDESQLQFYERRIKGMPVKVLGKHGVVERAPKGNKDTTDFRAPSSPDSDPACPFCAADRQNKAVALNGSVFVLLDGHPVAPGHHLVIPKRHTADYFSMTEDERRDATDLLRVLRKKILDDDTSVVGFNVGMNCGEAAGQTVMHAHVDLIPRRKGDTPQPRGGVRGVIPARMSY